MKDPEDLYGDVSLTVTFTFFHKVRMTIVITEEYHCYQVHTKFYPTSFSQN
jgi:hypothetical protein